MIRAPPRRPIPSDIWTRAYCMQILRLLVKNAFRHKLRTSLTAFGIAVAILAFGLLRTTVGAWYAGVEASSSTRLVIRNAVSLIFPLPLSYQEKIRQVPGVKNVSYAYWFAGVYISEKNFFPNLALDPKSFYELRSEERRVGKECRSRWSPD